MCQCSHRATPKDRTTMSTKACLPPSSVQGSQVRAVQTAQVSANLQLSVQTELSVTVKKKNRAGALRRVFCILYGQLFLFCFFILRCVCACLRARIGSVGDVCALKQKPSPWGLSGRRLHAAERTEKRGGSISGLFVLGAGGEQNFFFYFQLSHTHT